MNKELWEAIEKFDFDFPVSEYGFSTRLAYENKWTEYFTKKAIEEYKKFMYLATTSNQMVSPSEIVDIVWHQHLIFTQSYTDFCALLGKKIQHIPSTHNKEEQDKFLTAKKHTTAIYESNFGKQPKLFWGYNSFKESLEIQNSKHEVIFILWLSVPFIILLVFLFRFLLYPVYLKIDNPYFIFGYILMGLSAFLGLNFYNKITFLILKDFSSRASARGK